MAVIVAVVLGPAVGLIFGEQAAGLSVIGTAFVDLVKMLIEPIIFCQSPPDPGCDVNARGHGSEALPPKLGRP